MAEQDLKHLREMLLKQRREVFERLRRFESDWQALGDRDSELEEEAQKADMTLLFDQLDERAKEEIEEIDLALCRMGAGSYGICEHCENLIPLKRLEALPTARLCRECADMYEKKQKKSRRAREMLPCKGVPDEYRDLSDDELQMVILERIRLDGRIDMEELEISCRRGVVYLEGLVPSEIEHQILLQILTDSMGFTSVIDLLQTSELVWEREDRAPGRSVSALGPEEALAYGVDTISEDVFETHNEGFPYSPPDRPVPEEE
jgi:RNA polymerase-binding protein DksA